MLLLAPLLDGCEPDRAPRPIDTSGAFDATVAPTDRDSDGSDSDGDCDDLDPTSYPGAPELCDGKDNDCDGLVDSTGPALDVCAREDRFEQTMQGDVLRTTFTLSAAAQIGTISVTVEPDDGSKPYPWDGAALSDPYTLVFADAPPPIGTLIVVDYLSDWRY